MSDYGLINPTPEGTQVVEVTDLREGDNFLIEGEPGKIFRATTNCELKDGFFIVMAETEEFEPYVVRFGKSDLAYAPKLYLVTAVQPIGDAPTDSDE